MLDANHLLREHNPKISFAVLVLRWKLTAYLRQQRAIKNERSNKEKEGFEFLRVWIRWSLGAFQREMIDQNIDTARALTRNSIILFLTSGNKTYCTKRASYTDLTPDIANKASSPSRSALAVDPIKAVEVSKWASCLINDQIVETRTATQIRHL